MKIIGIVCLAFIGLFGAPKVENIEIIYKPATWYSSKEYFYLANNSGEDLEEVTLQFGTRDQEQKESNLVQLSFPTWKKGEKKSIYFQEHAPIYSVILKGECKVNGERRKLDVEKVLGAP